MGGRLAKLLGRALLPRQRRAFLRDERGVTAIEFGLLAPPFFLIIGAILETSVVFLSTQILETALQDTARLVRTGQMQSSTSERFKTEICSRLYGLFNCDGLFLELQDLDGFSDNQIAPPIDFDCEEEDCRWNREPIYSPGQTSNYMAAQVYYRWPIILDFYGVTLANLSTGERVLGAATVFQNEPF